MTASTRAEAHPASLRQGEASDPRASTWLVANAGSGKTKVLTDRVTRLLLTGVEPQHILCLTYTKAAAAEMQNRLFVHLGTWAMLPDEELRAALNGLDPLEMTARSDLRAARRLFARAIETPGGLKIQTIHAFCASLLRRFPLEAGVSPAFAEIDSRSARLIRTEIADDIARDQPELFDALAGAMGGRDLDKVLAAIISDRDAFDPTPDRGRIHAALGLPAAATHEGLLRNVFVDAEAQLMTDVADAIADGFGTTDTRAARVLRKAACLTTGMEQIALLEGLFLFKSGPRAQTARVGSLPTKAARNALGPLLQRLEDFMLRIEAARPLRIGLAQADRAFALAEFAAEFLPRHERRMQAGGWLDFDDLIRHANRLLTRPDVAQWVLFKLDGGVDHILVDEAQDTSPGQWSVIALLSREFTAGEGARQVERSLFVVGDRKQSIYSFQGADLTVFDTMQRDFASRLEASGKGLNKLNLDHSFRSSPAILTVVDKVFDHAADRGIGGEVAHLPFFADMPGRVDLWPTIAESAGEEDRDWFDPVDIVTDAHHDIRLAEMLAREIRRMIEAGTRIPARPEPRRLTAGDILILVRKRSTLFHALIRACKAEGLPIAGADRLRLGGELAVRDIVALLSFLAMPEDDLSLAAALRSPLLGWDEAMLYDLAQPRGRQYLWEALRGRPDRHCDTLSVLQDLRNQSDFLRPFELIERLLTRHDGRRRLLARLGDEAEEGVDALLAQALDYERVEVPSLTGFLTWLSSAEVEIKRQVDSAGGRLRVMTVHGAKGLEAPVVVLPDTMAKPGSDRDALVVPSGGPPLWRPPAEVTLAALAPVLEERKRARRDEERRLLYVAMTRAQSWLIVAGAGSAPSTQESWHDEVAHALDGLDSIGLDTPAGPGRRLIRGAWPEAAPEVAPPTASTPPPLSVPPPPPASVIGPLRVSPSSLGGAKWLAPPGIDGDARLRSDEPEDGAAARRGSFLHRLLEHLPGIATEARAPLAMQLAAVSDPPLSAEEARLALDDASRLLGEPALAPLFSSDAMAEVEITAGFGPHRLLGAIDRLVVHPDHVLAVDFKSNAMVPDRAETVPDGLVRQMAAYADALAQIFPARRVEVALLWTRTAQLMSLPDEMLEQARRAALLDLAGGAS